MLRFLADENFNNNIIRGIALTNPEIDILQIQDVSLSGDDDPIVIEFEMKENRIFLTHDVVEKACFSRIPNA